MLKKFFSPSSIAIIGASTKPEKIGGILINNLLTGGYRGKIYPVNPKYTQIKDLPCYPSIKDLNQSVDLCLIATPASTVPDLLIACATLKNPIKNFIIISAGFSESGPEGKKLEQQISDLAQKYNLKILGPNCLGLINTRNRLNASFAPNNFLSGSIGLISQSGAFAAALIDLGKKENLGFSSIVTIGNKTILDETDFLAHFITDKNTNVIGLYLENIKHSYEFLTTLKKISPQKPVIVIKAGATPKTQAAITSHTGAMAGDEAVAEALIADCGGIVAHSLSEFLGYLKIFSYFKIPANNTVALITNAGGPGIIAADLVAKSDTLNLYEFSATEKFNLQKQLPEASSFHNPLDLRGDADHTRYETAIKTLAKNKKIGSLIILATAQVQTNPPAIWQAIVAAQKYCPFPVVPVIMSESVSQSLTPNIHLSNFDDPLYAVQALEKSWLWRHKKYQRYTPVKISPARQRKNNQYLAEIKKRQRSILLFSEAENLTATYGLNILPAPRLNTLDLATVVYPAVLKIDSDQILHKNKAGGLSLNLQNEKQLLSAVQTLRAKFPQTDLVVQKQTTPGLELIIGLKYDNNFGPVVMLALGGIATEIFNVKIFFSPLKEAGYYQEKIQDSVLGRLLAKQKINLISVVENIQRVATLAVENPDIKELDLNPIIFYPDQTPVVVDIKIVLK
ncbi:MAG TPA: acetate--CoA ligase family protein [bacterium]|mgnify:CR=1 FL=1|nr:acetate--CoA ligase family protein [bacterium]